MDDRYKFRAWQTQKRKMLSMKYLIEIDIFISVIMRKKQHHHLILMQSTGLKDKNNKLIFEGDICDGTEADYEDGIYIRHQYFRCVVDWDENWGQWFIEDWPSGERHPLYDYDDDILGAIVGNIHEHPELLCDKELKKWVT